MCNNPKQISGFTLLELMIVVAISGILMAMAVPSFNTIIRNNRLTTYANEFVSSLNLARSEAVKRGTTVYVRKDGTGTYWSSNGWKVFVDKNGNKTFDDTNTDILIKAYDKLPTTYTLAGNNNVVNYITFQADGTSNTLGSFAICDNSDGNNIPEAYTSKLIIVSAIGRVRMAKDTNGDGIPEKDGNVTLTSCISP